MKKTAKIIMALILMLALVVPGSAAAINNIGDTIVWTVEYDEDSRDVYYMTYKGEVETGYTWHGNLPSDNNAAFFFTAGEAGYYFFDSNDSVYVSDDIKDGNPVGYKDYINLYTEYDYSDCEDSRNFFRAYYFEANESRFVEICRENDYDENSDNSGYLDINFAGELTDIKIAEEKKYLIDNNIFLFSDEEETEEQQSGSYTGYLEDKIQVCFSGSELEVYIPDVLITGTEELKEGENTITLTLDEIKKETVVECFDIDDYIEDITINDNDIYIDYCGFYNYDNPVFTITFADGSTKTVDVYEYFEINGVNFYIDYAISDYEDDNGETGYQWYIDLKYGYTDEEYYADSCKWYYQDADVNYFTTLQNFNLMVSSVKVYISYIANNIRYGNFQSVFYNISSIVSTISAFLNSIG